jgi:AraC-like DNA-binding protein
MEVLTSVLSAMKLSGSVFLEANFTRPWFIESKISPEDCAAYFPEPAHVISYHYVMSGSCLCSVAGEPPVEVKAGQIVMVPRNEPHLMGDRLFGKAVGAWTLLQVGEDGFGRIDYGGGGELTKLCCGFLGTLSPINAFLLSLPRILVVDASSGTTGEWIASSIRYAASRPIANSAELLGRLAELLFVEAVTQYVETLPPGQRGWFAGMRDPHVNKALTLMHADPAEPWTTEALAREVGLSRSALAERFTSLLGEPPMRYLSHHRMNVAANMLREGDRNTSNIAYAVGFNSEAAFNRAFKKEFGVPPGLWRKEMCFSHLASA